MSLTVQKKVELIQPVQQHDKDTGSPQSQVTLLTERIRYLTEHFKIHKKDLHSKYGLQKMVNQRKKLLKYLKKHSADQYQSLIKHLKLRDSY